MTYNTAVPLVMDDCSVQSDRLCHTIILTSVRAHICSSMSMYKSRVLAFFSLLDQRNKAFNQNFQCSIKILQANSKAQDWTPCKSLPSNMHNRVISNDASHQDRQDISQLLEKFHIRCQCKIAAVSSAIGPDFGHSGYLRLHCSKSLPAPLQSHPPNILQQYSRISHHRAH